MPGSVGLGKLAVAAFLVFAVSGVAGVSEAAPPDAGRGRPDVVGVKRADPLLRRVQELLRELGDYSGAVDGVASAETRAAVRTYLRRAGLPETTTVGEPLVKQLESAVAVEKLLRRLEEARQEGTESARKALLGSEATRDLLGGKTEVANPTRDPSACFAQPNAACILAEAVESAKALSVAERRDWAFGEILVVQARAGLVGEARASARRMTDPRLIMVALRDIALAQARRLRNDEAIAAVATIPDLSQRMETLAEMALLQAAIAPSDALANARQASAEAAGVRDAAKAVAIMTRSALALARAGDAAAGIEVLASAKTRAEKEPGGRASLGGIATAYAEIGRVEDALALLERLPSGADRTPVLVAIAAAQAEAGQPQALQTAHSVAEPRFRAPALARVAEIRARKGDAAGARAAGEAAAEVLRDVDLPYARDTTQASIFRASAHIDRQPVWARADGIADPRVRAESLWSAAQILDARGDAAQADEARRRAREATAQVPVTLTRVWLLCDAAETRARQGAPDGARSLWHDGLEQTRPVGNAWVRARALARLAHALVAIDEAGPVPVSAQ